MTQSIVLMIPGDPQGQPRPRARAVPNGRGGFTATVYQPTRERGADNVVRDLPITVWRRRVAAEVARVLPPESWTGAIKLDVVFYFPRTQELLKPKHSAGLIPHLVRPDLDNLLKGLMDEMVEARDKGKVERRGILRDDCTICDLHTKKWYVERGAEPGAVVIVTRLSEPAPALPFVQTEIGGYKLAQPRAVEVVP